MNYRVAVFGLCLTLGAGAAAAQSGPGGPQAVFISPCGQPFRAPAGQESPVVSWFSKIDLNADRLLDREEFRAEATAFFKVLDQDGNGVIGSAEVTRYEQVIAPEILGGFTLGAVDGEPGLIRVQMNPGNVEIEQHIDRGFGGRLAPGGGNRAVLQGAAPYSLLADTEPVSGADLDLDGRITLVEFIKAADRRFARLDPDGDGKIRPVDLPLTLAEQRAKGGRSRPPA